jgi:hypothetical protein
MAKRKDSRFRSGVAVSNRIPQSVKETLLRARQKYLNSFDKGANPATNSYD